MGDGADQLNEAGALAWMEHVTGQCDTVDPCQYCADEEKKEQRDVPSSSVPKYKSGTS